jgi:hypothetical protein
MATEYFLGKRTRHSYAREGAATYGTAATASTWSWMGVVQSIAPTSKSELLQINSMDDAATASQRNVSDYMEILRTYGCTVEFLLQHCRPLTFAWGSDVYSATGVHTITETNTLPSFSLNFGYQHGAANVSAHAVDYTGCMVNKMDISCEKGEFVKCSMEVVAQKSTDHAFRDYQAAVQGMKKYPPVGTGAKAPYAYSDAAIAINGTTYTEVQSVRLTINNNLLSEPVLATANDKRISQPIPQLREYDASMTVKMATDDLYDLWETGAYITTDPTVTFARTAGTDQVVFTLNEAILESSISPFTVTEGVVLVELPFKVNSINPVETITAFTTDYDTEES